MILVFHFNIAGGRKLQGTLNLPSDLLTMPMYLRQGRIIPMWSRLRKSSSMMHKDAITLVIGLMDGYAYGTIYMDDFETWDYLHKNLYIYKALEFKNNKLSSISKDIKFRPTVHKYKNNDEVKDLNRLNRVERIIIYGLNSVEKITIDGRELEFQQNESELIVKDPKMLVKDDWEVKFIIK
eukprot:NODE_109_length_19684_cov_0.566709.p8 type:complete len:181 gc:universal NODE_109_length_19684_cov_0.566709:4129-3587(-)